MMVHQHILRRSFLAELFGSALTGKPVVAGALNAVARISVVAAVFAFVTAGTLAAEVTVKGKYWYDANANCVFDDNERTVPDCKIIFINQDKEVFSTTTDEAGCYEVKINGGQIYSVINVQQPGWKTTFPCNGKHTIGPLKPGDVAIADFGCYKAGFIKGMKWADYNCNGIKEDGEPGLEGWCIIVDNCWAATTDAEGNYCICVPPGTYKVCEVLKPGWIQTFPSTTADPPGKHIVTVGECETVTDIDFGNFKYSKIQGMKFADWDCDGVKDPGEPGLGGWTIKLTSANGGSGQTVVTDADGNYCFFVKPGTYVICEDQQTGWTQTLPADDGCYTVVIGFCETITDLDFGNFKYSKLEGCKWEDANCNCKFDDNENKVPDWKIVLKNEDGQPIDTTFTDADGKYCFLVKPGTYIICECPREGWQQTFPKDDPCHTVTVDFCDTLRNLDFGNTKLSKIQGCKIWDVNCDGVYDPTEDRKVGGWVITLTDVNGNTMTTTTNDKGVYCFWVKPGTYEICEELRPTCFPTNPTTGCWTVDVKYCDTLDHIDFLNCCDVPPVTQWNDDDRSPTSSVAVDQTQLIKSLSTRPNPASDKLSISYELQEGGNASIEVYDLQGRQIAIVASGFRAAGQHELNHDIASLPAGSYQLLLRLGNQVQTLNFVVE